MTRVTSSGLPQEQAAVEAEEVGDADDGGTAPLAFAVEHFGEGALCDVRLFRERVDAHASFAEEMLDDGGGVQMTCIESLAGVLLVLDDQGEQHCFVVTHGRDGVARESAKHFLCGMVRFD